MPSNNTNTTPIPETYEEDPLLDSQLGSQDDVPPSEWMMSPPSDKEESDTEEAPAKEADTEMDTTAEEAPAKEYSDGEEDEDNDGSDSDSDEEKEKETPITLRDNLRAAEAVQSLLEMIKGREKVMEALGNKEEVKAAKKLIKMCREYLRRSDDHFAKARILLSAMGAQTATEKPERPMVKRATARRKPINPSTLPKQVLDVDMPEEVIEALVRFREGQATAEDMEFIDTFMSQLLDGPLANKKALNPVKAHETFVEAKGGKTRPDFDEETQALYQFIKFLVQCLLFASKHYSGAAKKADLPESGDSAVKNMTLVINILALTHGLNPVANCRRMPYGKKTCGAFTAKTKQPRLLTYLECALNGLLGVDLSRTVIKDIEKAIKDFNKKEE